MPAEALAAGLARRRRIGLRVALAVATGLTFDMATGAVIPFLGALFAAQFLVSGARPLPLAKAIGLVGIVLVVGQAFILLSGIFGDRPAQFLSLLGLFYFLCFFLQAEGRGGPAIFVCLVIAIMVPLLDRVHDKLDTSIIAILLQGCASGAILSWLAHAALPDPEVPDEAPVQAAGGVEGAAAHALASAVILLMAVTFCLTNSAFSTALVIPITVASLLLQLDLAAGWRAALGLVAVNLLGGVLASLAFAFVELRPSLLSLFLVVLLVGLILGGRATTAHRYAKIYGGALTTFLILLGTGLSPLPASTPESFATRVGYVLLAVVYTLCMTSLLWSRRRAAGRMAQASP
jgi:MFS family permease